MEYHLWRVVGVGFSVAALSHEVPAGADPRQISLIEKVPYDRLSFTQVYRDFRAGDRPLIITHVPQDQSPCFGSRLTSLGPSHKGLNKSDDAFVRAISNYCTGFVDVGKLTGEAQQRKGERRLGRFAFKEFMHLWQLRRFQWGSEIQGYGGNNIRTMCKRLWRFLRFPAYFSGDMSVHAAARGGQYSEDDVYPQFYFSQKGARMNLHVDVPKTEVWSAICSGRKRYWVSPASISWDLLGSASPEQIHNKLRYPAQHKLLPVLTGVAERGDIIYLPAGAVHGIWAEEDTINIVNNFVDVGALGGISQKNVELLSWSPEHRGMLDWLMDPAGRVKVRDARGIVTDADRPAQGFPTWYSLLRTSLEDQPYLHQATLSFSSPSAAQKNWDGIPRASMRTRVADYYLLEATEGVIKKARGFYEDYGLMLRSRRDLDAVMIRGWKTGGGIGIDAVELFLSLRSLFDVRTGAMPLCIFGIGNAFGYSALVMGIIFGGARIDFIDPATHEGTEATNRIAKARGFDIRVMQGYSPQDSPKAWQSPSYDLIFIDGKHTADQIKADIDSVLPVVKPRGVIIMHDIGLGFKHQKGKLLVVLKAQLHVLLQVHGFHALSHNGTNFVSLSGTLILHRGFGEELAERLLLRSLGAPGLPAPKFDPMYHCRFDAACAQAFSDRRERRAPRHHGARYRTTYVTKLLQL